MQFHFTFKHMETSEALRQHAEAKIKVEVDKFVTKPIECSVTFSVDRHLHTAYCSFNADDGFSCQVEHTSPDMYASVDFMIDKLQGQLRRHKEKMKDHKHRRPSKRSSENLKGREFDGAEIDAVDILKYEEARRKAAS
jgi:putative sigma-54 modulation protein